MTIETIIAQLEILAPPSLQEGYDNAGLITGNLSAACTGAIISLDATEEVVMEAVQKKCNLVISHHPIIFSGVKKITGSNYVQKAVIAAIKNDIALYAIHTNLDNVYHGVNKMIADTKTDLLNSSKAAIGTTVNTISRLLVVLVLIPVSRPAVIFLWDFIISRSSSFSTNSSYTFTVSPSWGAACASAVTDNVRRPS